jgi:D-alanyl-D-alanine carboxypeptidase
VFPVADTISKLPVSDPYSAPIPPIKISPSKDIQISSDKGIMVDFSTGEILFAKNADKKTPIASISKLVTALVFLDNNPGWDTVWQIRPEDRREGGKIYLFTGDRVLVRDLFNLSLTASANTATMAMVNSTGLSELEFVNKMNEKVKEIGLRETSFLDPIGLSMHNVSTAREVAEILKAALEKEEISKALLAPKYEFYTLDHKYKVAYSTDILLEQLDGDLKIQGGKTGYTESAGYCFASKITNNDNNSIISVVLDDVSHYARFSEVEKLAEWAYANYIW